MEHPIKMDDLGGPPLFFGNTEIVQEFDVSSPEFFFQPTLGGLCHVNASNEIVACLPCERSEIDWCEPC